MALLPKLTVKLGNTCDSIQICEKTDIYTVTTNEGGWGAPNIDTTDVIEADVFAYDHTESTLLEAYPIKDAATALDLYPSATPQPFIAINGSAWGQPDGVYLFYYEVVDNLGTIHKSERLDVLFCCNLQNCLWGIVTKMVEECDKVKLAKYKEVVDQIEVLLYGARAAFDCGDYAKAETLLANGLKLCENYCDPSCGC